MAWLKLIESAGNHLLALDPELLEKLKPLYGKKFRLDLIEPNFSVNLCPCPDGFIVKAVDNNDIDVDVRLSGSLWAFMQLAKQGTDSDVFERGRITLSGDTKLAESFQRILSTMQIDWEELTSKFVGDMAARNIHRLFDEFRTWFSQSREEFVQNGGEILHKELKITPSQVEADVITDQIETLRTDVSRLEARIAKLRAALEPETITEHEKKPRG